MELSSGEAKLVAVDWGTSSLRIWVLDAEGDVLDQSFLSAGRMMLAPQDYEPLLEQELGKLGVSQEVPAIVCGMAGSAGGWKEAGYVSVPTRLAELAHQTVTVPNMHREVCILPGIAQRSPASLDVMRGEETALLGLIAKYGKSDCTVCIPGTHSKWIDLKEEKVTGFSTFMTGELFSLLSSASTLSSCVDASAAQIATQPEFADAVREASSDAGRLSGALFSVRAGHLLTDIDKGASTARLSGLLIGHELAGNLKHKAPVFLVASGVLAETYSKAFETLGIDHQLADGFDLARMGLFEAAKSIWPELTTAVTTSAQ